MLENHISDNLYDELISKSSERCMAFQSMALPLIKNSSTVLQQSRYFLPGPSLCIFYFIFHKDKDSSAIPHPSVHYLVYVFPIFFCFHRCFNNFHLSKILLTYRFFHWNMCFFIFLLPWRRELSVSLWSKIISCD